MAELTKGKRTRARLMNAARSELVVAKGDLELARVAKRANVSPGLPYRYFDSKADLIAAVVDDFFDRFDEAVLRPDLEEVSQDWWTRERVRIERMVDFFYGDTLSPIVMALIAGNRTVTKTQRAQVSRQVSAARKNLAKGKASGAIPKDVDVELVAPMIMGGLFECVVSALTARPRMSKARVKRQLVRLVQHVLGL